MCVGGGRFDINIAARAAQTECNIAQKSQQARGHTDWSYWAHLPCWPLGGARVYSDSGIFPHLSLAPPSLPPPGSQLLPASAHDCHSRREPSIFGGPEQLCFSCPPPTPLPTHALGAPLRVEFFRILFFFVRERRGLRSPFEPPRRDVAPAQKDAWCHKGM